MEKKKSLSTILFGAALLLFVCATFAMFGAIVSHAGATFPNMFQAAFGTGDGQKITGMMAVFVLQMVVLAGVIAIIVGTATHKFHYILTIVIYGIVCVCSLIALIMSFNALSFYFKVHPGLSPDYALGAGPIAYSIMHILGLLTSAAGLVFSRRGN